jgi:ParB family chromosome partitioning protein
MGKLDELMKSAGGNAAESMGRTPAMPRASGSAAAPAQPARLQGLVRSRDAAEIPLEKIGPDPDQPREEFDEGSLGRLAESMRTRGQLQSIRVRWSEAQGRYVIICGERRWRAAALAGLATMSCVIEERPLDAGELLALQLVENALREDLKPLEQARAYRALMDRNGWSTHKLAEELAIDQSSVSRALALLRLPDAVQGLVEQERLSPATAYEVSKLDDAEAQAEVAARVVTEGLSRAETAEAVRTAVGRGSGRVRTRGGAGTKGRTRKVTSRTFRASDGYRATIERRRGIEPTGLAAALREMLAVVEAELDGGAGEGPSGGQAAA